MLPIENNLTCMDSETCNDCTCDSEYHCKLQSAATIENLTRPPYRSCCRMIVLRVSRVGGRGTNKKICGDPGRQDDGTKIKVKSRGISGDTVQPGRMASKSEQLHFRNRGTEFKTPLSKSGSRIDGPNSRYRHSPILRKYVITFQMGS
jgi:hypothetical protein